MIGWIEIPRLFSKQEEFTPRRDERRASDERPRPYFPAPSPRTKHNTSKIGEARCHRAFEQPPPTHTPPRSMRRGKKGSNKKGKVRTAHARPRGGRSGRPHRMSGHRHSRSGGRVLSFRLRSRFKKVPPHSAIPILFTPECRGITNDISCTLRLLTVLPKFRNPRHQPQRHQPQLLPPPPPLRNSQP